MATRSAIKLHTRHIFVAAALAALTSPYLQSCDSSDQPRAYTSDIFRDDEVAGSQRRRVATDAERLWTVNMRTCTGHLIAPDYMMTAGHCGAQVGATYTSGSALIRGAGPDITVAAISDSKVPPANAPLDGVLDYAILKITWAGGKAPTDQKYPPLVPTKAEDVAMSTAAGQGDDVFTVGFPSDKQGVATYSEGQLKELRQVSLIYNMGIINGNSGGGAWRKRDKMLVALTNAGPKAFNEAGWNDNDINDSTHWNYGTAMWLVFADSKQLQEIFPGGKNKFSGDQPPAPPSGTKQAIALGLSKTGTTTSLKQLAIPLTATIAYVCQGDTSCTQATAGVTKTIEVRATAGKRFVKLETPVVISANQILTLVATDAAGTVIETRKVRFVPAGTTTN